MRSICRLVTLSILIGSSSSPAVAKGPSAKELFQQAETHYQEGRYLDALDLYKGAYAKRPLAGFYINIGQCYRQLLRWKEAIAAYEMYLKLAPKGKHRARARELIALCNKEQDKLSAAKKPAPAAAVDPGAKKPDDMVSTKPVAPPPEPVATVPTSAPSKEPEVAKKRGLSKVLFWGGVGLTGALLATTAITGAMALSKSDDYKNPATPSNELQDLKDSGETLRTVSTITFVAGLVAAAGTTVLFFFTDWKGPSSERDDDSANLLNVSAGPVPGGAVVGVRGRF